MSVVGVLAFSVVPREDGRVYFVHELTTALQARRRGVGTRLLTTMLQGSAGASSVHLIARASNAPAIALYASLGFEARSDALEATAPVQSPGAGELYLTASVEPLLVRAAEVLSRKAVWNGSYDMRYFASRARLALDGLLGGLHQQTLDLVREAHGSTDSLPRDLTRRTQPVQMHIAVESTGKLVG